MYPLERLIVSFSLAYPTFLVTTKQWLAMYPFVELLNGILSLMLCMSGFVTASVAVKKLSECINKMSIRFVCL